MKDINNSSDLQEKSEPPYPKETITKPVRKKSSIPSHKLLNIIVAIVVLILAGTAHYLLNLDEIPQKPSLIKKDFKIEKFKSEADFKNYLAQSEKQLSSLSFGGIGGLERLDTTFQALEAAPSEPKVTTETVDRVSETNIQVAGIDEPDIVKTDGTQIYFSPESRLFMPVPMFEPGISREQAFPSQIPTAETKVISAFPPTTLSEIGNVEKQGTLLLSDKILIIFSNNQILGYDVTDPANPTKAWEIAIENQNQVASSRLFQNKLYVIVKSYVTYDRPCPVPIFSGTDNLSISCTDIYHPTQIVPTDSTFTAMSIDPKTGTVEKSVSFTSSSNSSVIYMSQNALYITHTYNEDVSKFLYNFYLEKGSDLISEAALAKIQKLVNYDISTSSKLMEIQVILQEFYNSLSADERRKVQNEMTNKMSDYLKEKSRDLQKTGIIKINVNNFSITASGEIPGSPLNQFSLDEYQENLRIATTVSGNLLGWGRGESVNDVYVLNSNLNILGSVENLGITEQIYSARFFEDKGYVVTFRRTDPFYVIDLSDPKNPKLKGELKIPGYSSYLHPIEKDKILGIGEESNKVKLSLFDVAKPENPTETDKYLLDEYYSEVESTHHAFLLDPDHRVFFLPASRGGYIFGYKNDELELVRAVADIQARRAIYINDYMYIIGDDEIVVFNEIDWAEVNSLDLQ